MPSACRPGLRDICTIQQYIYEVHEQTIMLYSILFISAAVSVLCLKDMPHSIDHFRHLKCNSTKLPDVHLKPPSLLFLSLLSFFFFLQHKTQTHVSYRIVFWYRFVSHWGLYHRCLKTCTVPTPDVHLIPSVTFPCLTLTCLAVSFFLFFYFLLFSPLIASLPPTPR